MPSFSVVAHCEIARTPRVMQIEGMFEVPPSQKSSKQWDVSFELPEDWNVGVIVGPSGAGKSTVARELFKGFLSESFEWSADYSLLDDFPKSMTVKEITGLLSSVGFSSPPSWLRPYSKLSNGEQFRVHLARTLAESSGLAVVDEFTSVVDRTVAQIGSAAVAKAIRKRKTKFVAVSCHYDILDWLEPDWVYEPHTQHFYTGRGVHQRPQITLEIIRCEKSAWDIFKHHHYLDTSLNPTSRCFMALWDGTPVAFASSLYFPHPIRPAWREHRTVCLPDYQGVGIGNALSNAVAAAHAATGRHYISSTSSPAMIWYRAKSKIWQMKRKPSRGIEGGKNNGRGLQTPITKVANNRFTAGFEYVGAKNHDLAKSLGLI